MNCEWKAAYMVECREPSGAIVVTNAPSRNPHGLLAEYTLSAEILVAPDILIQELQFVVIYSSLCILNWSPAAAFPIANWNRFVETTYVTEYWRLMASFVCNPVTKASLKSYTVYCPAAIVTIRFVCAANSSQNILSFWPALIVYLESGHNTTSI